MSNSSDAICRSTTESSAAAPFWFFLLFLGGKKRGWKKKSMRRNTSVCMEIREKLRTCLDGYSSLQTDESLWSSGITVRGVHVLFSKKKKERKKLQQYFSHVIVMYSAAHEIAHRQANLEEPHPLPPPGLPPHPTPLLLQRTQTLRFPSEKKINK